MELQEPARLQDSGKVVPNGTMLYLAYDAEQTIAFCTSADWSSSHLAKVLWTPALDRRPCFIDSRKDGHFDEVFTVYDLPGSPPGPRGDTAAAKPITPISYKQVDIHKYPIDMRMEFVLKGDNEIKNSRLLVQFKNAGRGQWWPKSPAKTDAGYVFHALDAAIMVNSLGEKQATISIAIKPGVAIRHDLTGMVTATPIPDFVRTSQMSQ